MKLQKGRGAQINPANRFDKHQYFDHLDDPRWWEEEERDPPKTVLIPFPAKNILSKVTSPDLPMDWSLNPYQGCEHGCVYCYARETHAYWGYSAGLDFEQKILYKPNAAELLEETFRKPKWQAAPIMLAGNTDIYQPVERQLRLTRSLLEVFWKYRHPVGMITKNSLILRDLDLIRSLAEHNLVSVAISVTTLDEGLRSQLEPRTATSVQRLRTIRTLREAGVPVIAMIAPIIPGLTDHEIFDLVKAVAEAGASNAYYTMVRLNGDIGPVFEDWVRRTLPDRADRILNRIQDCHGGTLEDRRFGTRMRGEGKYADAIRQQFHLAKKKFMPEPPAHHYNLNLHEHFKSPQLRLF